MLIEENQLHYTKYPPFFGEILRRNDEIDDKNQILWYITRRRYLKDKKRMDSKVFLKYIKSVVTSEKLLIYLKDNNITLKICLHQFIRRYLLKKISKFIDNDLIKIVDEKSINIYDELASSKLLITDYSGHAFEFSYLDKPVVLFQPDLDVFSEELGVMYDFIEYSDLEDYVIKTPLNLVNKIISQDYESIPYLKIGNKEDYDLIKHDNHINELYKYFYNMQMNKITFVGYNFYGIGGTVNATMALAEGLLEKGYLVDLVSLKRIKLKHNIPNGLNVQYLYWEKNLTNFEKLSVFLHNLNKRNLN